MADETNKSLSVREKLAVYLILLLIKIIKPMNYSHELDKVIEEIKTELK